MEESSATVTKELNGIRLILNSLADIANIHNRFMETTVHQGLQALCKIGEELGKIKDELRLANSLQVQGSNGPNGFAQHVYDFIQMRIDEVGDGLHMFFVYHPDTNWYPSFRKLIRSNPLPPTFCAKSDCLDTLVVFMRIIREGFAEAGKPRDQIVFHLLMPAWAPCGILEPLHFPKDIFPLSVEGLTHQGRPYMALNCPAAPQGLFKGVANILDPNGYDQAAEIAGAATFLIGGGWVLNGVALAVGLGVGALTGGGALVAMPIWFGGSAKFGFPAAIWCSEQIQSLMAEEKPRILGSRDRMLQ